MIDGPVRWDELTMPWRAWTPDEVTRRLAGLSVPWAVAGGWAVDLHLGAVRRTHDDLEICTPAAGSTAVLAAFPGPRWRWFVPEDGVLHPLDGPGGASWLDREHQTWLWSVDDGAFVLDVFREPHDGDTWICRRDAALRRPLSDVYDTTPTGIPHVRPEIVLLFKARHARPKDEVDFAACLPALDEPARVWLRDALAHVHPGHPWIERLSSS